MNIEDQKALDYIPQNFDALINLDDDALKLIMSYYKAAIVKTKEALAHYANTKMYDVAKVRLDKYREYLQVITHELEALQLL